MTELAWYELCSTPSGITGTITPYPPDLSNTHNSAQRLPASQEQSPRKHGLCLTKSEVLNAFRHHRNNHNAKPHQHSSAKPSSTPSGITGTITMPTRPKYSAAQSAQRLPASQEQSLYLIPP